MKQHLAAICFNEKELEQYVNQLRSQVFEALSDIKKAEDGSFYQAMAKTLKQEASTVDKEKRANEISLVP